MIDRNGAIAANDGPIYPAPAAWRNAQLLLLRSGVMSSLEFLDRTGADPKDFDFPSRILTPREYPLSLLYNLRLTERWPSGRRRLTRNQVYGNVSWVRIPPSPPPLLSV